MNVVPANLWPCLTEHCIVRSDSNIRHHMQYMASSDCVAGNHGDNGFGTTTHLNVQVEYSESGHVFRTVIIATFATNALISAGAKGRRTFSREDDDTNPTAITTIQHVQEDKDGTSKVRNRRNAAEQEEETVFRKNQYTWSYYSQSESRIYTESPPSLHDA